MKISLTGPHPRPRLFPEKRTPPPIRKKPPILPMLEYWIGGERPEEGYTLTPNSAPVSTILFTELYSKMVFHMLHEKNTNNLCAIEIDNDIIIGTRFGGSKPTTITFAEGKNYFDSMVFQQVLRQAGDKREYSWSNITYLELVYQGKTYTMGEQKQPGLVKIDDTQGKEEPLNHLFLEPVKVSHPFYISGICIHNAGIYALQIIAFDETDDAFRFDELQYEFVYNQGKFGIVEAIEDVDNDDIQKLYSTTEMVKCEADFTMEHMILDDRIPCYDNPDPIKLLHILHERCLYWTTNRSITSSYYPKFVALIDQAILKREYSMIHSVLRLDRYLTALIRGGTTFNPDKKYQKDIGITLKVSKVWGALADTMKLAQKIHNGDLELNCYQIAYLSQTPIDKMYALITIICQIGLILLLGMSLWKIDTTQTDIFPLYEGIAIIPIIFIFTVFVVSKQFTNTLTFYRIFPDMIHTFVGKCDIFSNMFCACVIVFLNFFVLAFSDSLMDIVLNSLASLFIIALDDEMVFLSSDNKDDLFRQKCISTLNQKFKEIPEIYFEDASWRQTEDKKYNHMHEGFVEVDRAKCEMVKRQVVVPPGNIV